MILIFRTVCIGPEFPEITQLLLQEEQKRAHSVPDWDILTMMGLLLQQIINALMRI